MQSLNLLSVDVKVFATCHLLSLFIYICILSLQYTIPSNHIQWTGLLTHSNVWKFLPSGLFTFTFGGLSHRPINYVHNFKLESGFRALESVLLCWAGLLLAFGLAGTHGLCLKRHVQKLECVDDSVY